MKDYYEIMKVGRKATDAEIKKAFRKLANQYHPDKNPAYEAEAIFKEINEAYEVLGDAANRLDYDQKLANPAFYEYQNTRQQQNTAPYPRRPSERAMLQLSLLRYSRLLFYFGCLWCSVLVVDYLMPANHIESAVLTDMSKLPLITFHQPQKLLVTSAGHGFDVSAAEMKHFPLGSKVHVYYSSFLRAMIRIENYDGTYIVNNLGSIYRNFSFAPILLFLSCVIGIVVKKGVEFHVNLGIVVFLLMILNIALLYSSTL
ncbi:MAG TPA: DnaJ domain-containing protein [Cyclobacteriaceae bacterium]|nr:DnaJ domain-containing protein [Cyclobacteriaceae bacterium]